MITIFYKASAARSPRSKNIAYVKKIDGGTQDKLRFFIEALECGTVHIGGKELVIKDSVAEIDISDIEEGINRPTIIDKKGNAYRTEGFLCERGFIKRAPIPDGFSSEVVEAFDTIDAQFEEIERMMRELTSLFAGAPFFKFD